MLSHYIEVGVNSVKVVGLNTYVEFYSEQKIKFKFSELLPNKKINLLPCTFFGKDFECVTFVLEKCK